MMLLEFFLMLWVSTLVFSALAIIYPQRFFLLLIPFILWNTLGLLTTNIVYLGYGSVNIITQSYNLGDPFLPSYTIWIFHGIGMLFLIYAFGTYFQMAAKDLEKIGEHRYTDGVIGRPES